MTNLGGRPPNGRNAPTPPALAQWPGAPSYFGPDEDRWWERLGEAAQRLGTISEADLPIAARAVQISVRVDKALADDDFKPTALNALLRLELDYWKQLGLSPQARRAVSPLPTGEEPDDPLREFKE